MKLSTSLIALGLGTAVLLSACDRRDERTDAVVDRERADEGAGTSTPPPAAPGAAGQMSANGPADASGTPTLAMSGTPSSHLVDGAGSAVYVLGGNTDGSRCDQACQEVWPPVMAHDAQPVPGPGVEASRLGTLERDGRSHVTYGGQPLYRYAGDTAAGRTTGAGVEDQWGKWSLVGLDGQALADPE
jgi:predicted lipoprotein with Yx(FWY)xxD motif